MRSRVETEEKEVNGDVTKGSYGCIIEIHGRGQGIGGKGVALE